MKTHLAAATAVLLTLFIQRVRNEEVPPSGSGSSNNLKPEHRAGGFPLPHYGPPLPIPSGPSSTGYGPPSGGDDLWPLGTPDMPQIKHLQVQCEKTHMRVNIEFDRPFYGMIFSKGHYSDPHCVHLPPGTGHLSATFDIYLNGCGMTSSSNQHGAYGQPSPSGSFVENTIILQYDPLVQEVWDQARKLRCTWYDFYEKSVTFRPFQVDMLNAITANFLGDNLQCWMQIQVGKGPWASEVSGIVKIGQTMTMVLAIKDDENKFDMLVRNCVAHDGKRAPIQLVDQYGCVTRPKIMSKFQKIKNFGSSASVVSYAYFQAFKFPDSMNVHFQCVIQVCRYQCPEPKCGGGGGILSDEYGPPQGHPDPRHPAGAYTEPVAEGVPLPLSGPGLHSGPALSASGAPPHLPPLPPLNQPIPAPLLVSGKPAFIKLPQQHVPGGYPVKREGVAPEEPTFAALGGRPRSVDVEVSATTLRSASKNNHRPARSVRVYRREATDMTDIETTRVIQVVAPGDVAFSLNGANETVVVETSTSFGGEGENSICMTIPSFVGGLIMLLLLLVVACLVSAFLFFRIRSLDQKSSTTTFIRGGYDNPEFVKMSSS